MDKDGSGRLPYRIELCRGALVKRAALVLLAALVVTFLPFKAIPATGLPAATADPINISGVKVEVKTVTTGSNKGNTYLRVHFTATPNDNIPPKMNVRIRGAVKVGGQTVVDEISSLGQLDKLAVGQPKNNFSPLFMSKGLPGNPESAELTFWLVKILDKRGSNLGTFCWNGSSVRPGPCRD